MNSDTGKNGFVIRACVFAMSTAVFFMMLFLVQSGKAAAFDDAVRFFFYDMRSGALTSAAKVMTYLGNWQSVTVLCIILLIIKPTRIRYGIPVSAGAISVTVINKIIKNLVRRERPDISSHKAGRIFVPERSFDNEHVRVRYTDISRQSQCAKPQSGERPDRDHCSAYGLHRS